MPQPLRLLFVNSGLGYGGAETQLIQAVRELKMRGHEPHVYLLTRTAPRAEELTSIGVPVFIDEKRRKIDLAVVRRIRRYVLRERIDLVHSFLFDANIYARLAVVSLKTPLLNAERSSNYRLSGSQALANALTRWRVDGVVANSHVGREFAQRLLKVQGPHSHVNWNGIDVQAVESRCRSCEHDYKDEFFGSRNIRMAVFVGSINPSKDLPLALAASDELTRLDPNWRVLFVGSSFDGTKFDYEVSAVAESEKLAREIEEQRKKLSHPERIKFVGRRSDAVEIISQADVLFSTSIREGFPNVILEAMTVGTPVVSTNYSDIKRILPDPKWVIDSRSPAEMARAMLLVNEQRGMVAEQLKRWVGENATIKKSIDVLLGIYAKYLPARRVSA